MALPQLSPNAVIGNTGQINPLANVTHHHATAAAAGTVAQQKTTKQKSDSVTISREALEKAAHPEAHDPEAKSSQTQQGVSEKTAAQ